MSHYIFCGGWRNLVFFLHFKKIDFYYVMQTISTNIHNFWGSKTYHYTVQHNTLHGFINIHGHQYSNLLWEV